MFLRTQRTIQSPVVTISGLFPLVSEDHAEHLSNLVFKGPPRASCHPSRKGRGIKAECEEE